MMIFSGNRTSFRSQCLFKIAVGMAAIVATRTSVTLHAGTDKDAPSGPPTPEELAPFSKVDWPARHDSMPRSFARLGKYVLFSADDGIHGRELWRTDGTEQGTALVKNIAERFLPSMVNTDLTVAGDFAYFTTGDSQHPGWLWRSDGTAAGTIPLTGFDDRRRPQFGRERIAVGDTLYFVVNYDEIWKSDGTEDGTRCVKDFPPDRERSQPRNLAAAGDVLFFTAWINKKRQLWRTDGTEEGTIRLSELKVHEHLLTPVGEKLFFTAEVGRYQHELFVTDGTRKGTVQLTRIGPLGKTALPSELTPVDGALYFRLTQPKVPNFDPHRHADFQSTLWHSDGTPEDTARVLNLVDGEAFSNPSALVAVDKTLYLVATADGQREIWKTRGTRATTQQLSHLPDSYYVSPTQPLIVHKDVVVFTAQLEAWISDGTEAGTSKLSDSNGSMSYYEAEDSIAVGGVTFFTTQDGHGGSALWQTNGTVTGTRLTIMGQVQDGRWHTAIPRHRSDGFDGAILNDFLVFAAWDPEAGMELWKSDGTREGTVLVKDINQTSPTDGRQ